MSSLFLHVFLGVGYFACAKLGLYLATLNSSVSPVWPATGFAFSIVYLFGRRALWAVAFGAFAANFQTGAPLLSTSLIAIGNTSEAFVGAWAIQWLFSFRKSLAYQTETIAVTVASMLGSLVSATVGVFALYCVGVVSPDQIFSVWGTWWVGDTLGGFVVTPFLIQYKRLTFNYRDIFSSLILVCLGCGIFYFVFMIPSGSPYLFLLFPILLMATTVCRGLGVLAASIVMCFLCVLATANGFGPFTSGSLNEKLLHLQLFLAAFAITAMMLFGFRRAGLSLTTTTVLIISWFFSGALFYSFEKSESDKADLHFKNLVEKSQERILDTVKTYEQALRGAAGFFSVSPHIDEIQWRSYFERLNFTDFYTGISRLGVVWPKHNQYLVKFVEPKEQNEKGIGWDMSSDPILKSAADLSVEIGEPTMTSKVLLNQGEPGFIYFLPIYKNQVRLQTLEERKRYHKGWIYGSFSAENFFSTLLHKKRDHPYENYLSALELKVYDADSISPDHLLFDSFSHRQFDSKYYRRTSIEVGQRPLTLIWRSTPDFISSHNTIIAWVGFCGALASLLITNLLVGLQIIGSRSREMAEDLTKELSISREKFKEGERRLLYALDGSNDGIWDWNIEKSEMYVSQKIAETHGWPVLSHVHSIEDLKKFAHPDDLEKITRSLYKYFQGETEVHEVETRYRTLSGEWKWMLTRGKISERNASGKPTRMTGVHIDIHTLKETQSLLENTQHQLREIADSVPTLISQWNAQLKCEFANETFAQWTSKSSEDLIGLPLIEIIGEKVYQENEAIFLKVLSGQPHIYEKEVTRFSDGQKRFIIATYLPNHHDPTSKTTNGFFLFIQDITELKQAELAAVEERRVALEATNVKSQFLANMTHEIRTPINGIIGMTHLLRETGLTSQQNEYVDLLSRSSVNLLDLVNNILDFSKIEAGKVDLEIVEFDLSELLGDLKKSLSFVATDKKISLDLKSQLVTKRFFRGDSLRLRQVLTNLTANAIKFTHRGNVEVSVEEVETEIESSSFRFSVKDTGIGIAKEALTRMFQPFSQADATTSRKFGGTGLGLSISKQLIELMGGTISVKSEEGVGSEFLFILKLGHGRQQLDSMPMEIHHQQVHSSVEKKIKGHLLVVDDNKVNQFVISENLRRLSYSYDVADNGLEALNMVEKNKYDLILMDCQMPELDGYEATRRIRMLQDPMSSRTPIIALTANAVRGDRERCLAVGMNDYLTKPIDVPSLARSISHWMQTRAEEVTTEENQGSMKVYPDIPPDLLSQLMSLFVKESEENMHEIRMAFAEKDNQAVARVAHILKSSAAHLRMNSLVHWCLKLERCKDMDLGSSEAVMILKKLEDEQKKAVHELQKAKKAS